MVEGYCGDHKEPKECNLDEKSHDDEFFTYVVKVDGSGCLNASTTRLHEKRYDVTCDKYPRQPVRRDER